MFGIKCLISLDDSKIEVMFPAYVLCVDTCVSDAWLGLALLVAAL
jgi:hypothetical protein